MSPSPLGPRCKNWQPSVSKDSRATESDRPVKQLPSSWPWYKGHVPPIVRWPTVVDATLFLPPWRFVIDFGLRHNSAPILVNSSQNGHNSGHKCRENFAQAQAVQFRKDTDGLCRTNSKLNKSAKTESECSTLTNPRPNHRNQPTKVQKTQTSVQPARIPDQITEINPPRFKRHKHLFNQHESQTSTLHHLACIEDANSLVNGFTPHGAPRLKPW